MENEYRFLLYSVLNSRTTEEYEIINELFSQKLDWEKIGGQLINHRLEGYFLKNISKELYNKVPKEIMNTLELLKISQKKQIEIIGENLVPIFMEFHKRNVRYIGLKGLILNASIYEPGYRRSNDSDILVHSEDLNTVNEILIQNGYKQDDESIGNKIDVSIKVKNSHALVPYKKNMNEEFIYEHSIDINYHVNNENNDITLKLLNYGSKIYSNQFYKVRGLPEEINLAYLCVDFYEERLKFSGVNRKKNLMLYKLVDIYHIFRLCIKQDLLNNWSRIIEELHIDNAVYYTLYVLNKFYQNDCIQTKLNELNIEYVENIFEEFEKLAFNLVI